MKHTPTSPSPRAGVHTPRPLPAIRARAADARRAWPQLKGVQGNVAPQPLRPAFAAGGEARPGSPSTTARDHEPRNFRSRSSCTTTALRGAGSKENQRFRGGSGHACASADTAHAHNSPVLVETAGTGYGLGCGLCGRRCSFWVVLPAVGVSTVRVPMSSSAPVRSPQDASRSARVEARTPHARRRAPPRQRATWPRSFCAGPPPIVAPSRRWFAAGTVRCR
jgi:hypothetical protein